LSGCTFFLSNAATLPLTGYQHLSNAQSDLLTLHKLLLFLAQD